ncbi:MAG: type II toxin-antitoxin system VapC family toxin [Alphaproteobacteria bacterium]|nr:type II toxin-antitoxin system VapC family toxin [Alphaproteobacteria bacterium]
MKRFLLDTKAFLAVLDGQIGLSDAFKGVFEAKDAVFYVSSMSFFEIAVKKALKKVRVPDNLADITKASGIQILPVLPEHALRTGRLPFHHTDPYDRMLIAQAKTEGMTLVSHNPIFKKYHEDTVTA